MPNWCENDLYISGSKEDVARVLAHVGMNHAEPEFDFNTVIPYPQEYRERDESAARFNFWTGDKARLLDETARDAAKAEHIAKYGNDRDGFNAGGYEWCSANWGTKWDASCVERRDYNGVCISFRTAWCAPHPVIVALAKLFPTCTFRIEYFERGMCLAGGFECPCAEDFYEEGTEWEAGVIVNEWKTDKYQGGRGG